MWFKLTHGNIEWTFATSVYNKILMAVALLYQFYCEKPDHLANTTKSIEVYGVYAYSHNYFFQCIQYPIYTVDSGTTHTLKQTFTLKVIVGCAASFCLFVSYKWTFFYLFISMQICAVKQLFFLTYVICSPHLLLMRWCSAGLGSSQESPVAHLPVSLAVPRTCKDCY